MYDKTLGISLHHRAESELQIDLTDQFWLELIQAPFLTTLDLTSTKSGTRHVHVRQAPELKHISNPNFLSLVLHLDLFEHRQPLLVDGPIEYFDCCWDVGDYLHKGKSLLRQLLICPIERCSDYQTIIEGLTADSCLLLINYDRGSELPKTLRLNTSASVVIIEVPQFTSLYSKSPSANIVVDHCADIHEAQGTGGTITIQHSGKNHLAFSGEWQNIELVGCKIHRLSIKDAQKLYLRGASSIKNAHVPDYVQVINQTSNHFLADVFPEINEATLLQLYDVFVKSDSDDKQQAIHRLLGAISKASRRTTVYHSVKLLHAIAEHTDVYDSLVIQTRKAILQKRGWLFPNDLVNEGWQTDVKLWFVLKHRIWKLALNASFETYFFQHMDKRECFYAVLNQALEVGDEVVLRRVMRRVNGTIYRKPRWVTHDDATVTRAYKRLMIALPRLSQPTQVAAIHFIFDALDKSGHVKQLPKLMKVAPQATRMVAFKKAHKADPLFKSYYLAIALSAVPQGEIT